MDRILKRGGELVGVDWRKLNADASGVSVSR